MPKVVNDMDVFRAVMKIMVVYGYDGTTTKQMAEAAGISEVTLFRKYGSKAQLVKLAIVAIADQLDLDSAAQYTGDAAADLLRIVERYQYLASNHGQFMAMLLPEISRHPELVDVLDRPMGIMRQISRLISQYQEEGGLQPENPLHAASALLGPLIYFAMMRGSLLDANLPPIDLPLYVTHFLHGRRATSKKE